jgi:plastocyanin
MNRFLFALRRSAILTLVLAFGVVLAACSSNAEESTAAGESQAAASAGGDAGSGGAEVVDGTVEVTAENMAFSTDTITATAGEDFTISFTNNDTVPHNLSVYTEEGGEVIVQGEILNQGGSEEIDVSALEPGTYYFMCDLHPEMNGQLVVEG